MVSIPRRAVAIATLLVLSSALNARAQDWTSPTEARALVGSMQGQQVEAVAAADPADPARFVAALLMPGQLLVVSGTHPSPDVVRARLQAGDFRGVYMDLQASPDAKGRFFVHDLNADGLGIAGRGEPFDNIYDGGSALSCDGQWKSAKLEEREYLERVGAADTRYAGILRVLAQSVRAAKQ